MCTHSFWAKTQHPFLTLISTKKCCAFSHLNWVFLIIFHCLEIPHLCVFVFHWIFVLIVSILPLKYQSQMANSLIFFKCMHDVIQAKQKYDECGKKILCLLSRAVVGNHYWMLSVLCKGMYKKYYFLAESWWVHAYHIFTGIVVGTPYKVLPPPHTHTHSHTQGVISYKFVHQLRANDPQNCGLWVRFQKTKNIDRLWPPALFVIFIG